MEEKTDRRKWNKSNSKNFDFDYPDVNEEIRKRYDDYLINLHMHNQVSKVLNEKDPKERELNQKESGFSLYVNGAHKLPEKFTPRYAVTGSARHGSSRYNSSRRNQEIPVNFVPKLHIRKEQQLDNDRCKSAPGNRRKQWLNSSITIKTMDGLNIKLCAPPQTHRSCKTERENNNAEYYSDDFEADSSENEEVDEVIVNKKKNKPEIVNTEELITSVKFSDTSSASEVSDMEIGEKNILNNKSNKQCLRLSKADVKFLRQSINSFNVTLSEDSLEDEIEIDCKLYDKETNNKNKSTPSFGVEDANASVKQNPKCNMLLENISNLNVSEKKLLLKFLKSIDDFNDL